jgi:hypothetical protein
LASHLNKIKSFIGDFVSAGADMIRGLIRGIGQMAGQLVDVTTLTNPWITLLTKLISVLVIVDTHCIPLVTMKCLELHRD